MKDKLLWARETSFWHFNGALVTIQVCLRSPEKNEIADSWTCTYWIIGFEPEIKHDIIGANAIQAINLAMSMIKHQLVLKLDEGYTHCHIDENKAITSVLTKRQTMLNLNSVYGNGTMLDKAHIEELCLQAIERLHAGIGNEQEQDNDLQFLKKHIADPKISDYIFYNTTNLTPEAILVKALAYKALQL